MATFIKHWRMVCGLAAFTLALLIVAVNLWLPEQPSEEYFYTVRILAKILLPALLLSVFALWATQKEHKTNKGKVTGLILCGFGLLLAQLIFWMPNGLSWQVDLSLSFIWAVSFFCIGIGSFFLGASAKAILASVFCVMGSVFLAFGLGEVWLIATGNEWDGLHYDNKNSLYVINNEAKPSFDNVCQGICGSMPQKLGEETSVAQRYLLYSQPLFDVKYTFNKNGHRILPQAMTNASYNLMLFGCSFTFGHGLANDLTWPYQLASLLGPTWRLENYAFNGFGANQMLCFLEHNLVEKTHSTKNFAIFLAIQDHLRRNEFFGNMPHYKLENGSPVQEGSGKYIWLQKIPAIFNGSQIAKKLSQMGSSLALKISAKDNERLYLAMLKRSAELLRQKYDTKLIVALWPDMDYLAQDIEDMGIDIFQLKQCLGRWDQTNGQIYQIAYPYEGHPNSLAANDIAAGLAKYLHKLTSD